MVAARLLKKPSRKRHRGRDALQDDDGMLNFPELPERAVRDGDTGKDSSQEDEEAEEGCDRAGLDDATASGNSTGGSSGDASSSSSAGDARGDASTTDEPESLPEDEGDDSAVSGMAFLRSRYHQRPSSLNHDWGPWKFTIKKNSRRRWSWQARCPFHRTSEKVLCKLSMTIPCEDVPGNLDVVNQVLRLLKYWCCCAPDFGRRRSHRAFAATLSSGDVPPDAILDAQRQQEVPLVVLDDSVLDAVGAPDDGGDEEGSADGGEGQSDSCRSPSAEFSSSNEL